MTVRKPLGVLQLICLVTIWGMGHMNITPFISTSLLAAETDEVSSSTSGLVVSPLVLDYGFTLSSLKFTIKNDGTGSMNWTARENPDESWIAIIGASSGILNAGQSTQVQVDIVRTGLPNGPNYGEILVTSNAGSQPIDIIVEVGPTPTSPILYIEPPVLDFNIGLTSLTFKVKNRGVGNLTWQATENPSTSWITSISPGSGSLATMEEQEVTVQVSRASLGNGQYQSLISISSNAGNKNIEVELIVGQRPQVIRANVGGNSYADRNGNNWSTDRPYHAGAWGHVRGHPYSVTADIKNTQDDALYRDELYWLDAYRFDVSNGNYTVTLHFAELYYDYTNGRVFDLYIEDNLVLNDFDIYAEVGFQTAAIRQFSGIAVNDGRLDIEFVHIKAHGELTAIELIAESAQPPSISVSPGSLYFIATLGGSNPAPQTITITNSGGGTLAWTAAEQPDQPWMSLSNTSGGSGDKVTVSVTSAGLSVGTYQGTVRISDPSASNNPVDVPVTLTVESQQSGPLVLELKDHSYAYPGEDWTNAIDGDVNGWDGTVTTEGDPPYAVFGFSGGATRQINKVRLLTDTGVGFSARWVKEFRVQVSTTNTSPSSFTTVLTATKSGGAWQEYSFAAVSAKYVKLIIDQPSSGYRQLGEFEVYGGEGGSPTPIIAVNPTSLSFIATLGGSNPAPQTITITNSGGETLAWTAAEQPDQPWMSLSNTSGGSGDKVTVSVTSAGLSVGTYQGTVRISDPSASNNPVDVPVTLTVESQQSGPLVLELKDHSYAYPGEDWTNAIDGDVNGWDGTVTTEGDPPYAVFGFSGGATRQINKVRLLTDTGVGFSARWVKEFRVQVSTTNTSPSSFTTVLTATKSGGAWQEYSFAAVSAKYVKLIIDQPSSGYRQLGEFEVYSSDMMAKENAADSPLDQEAIAESERIWGEAASFKLGQNYPNPFNPSTAIQFEIPEEDIVSIVVFDILGHQVKILINERLRPGLHEVQWNGNNDAGMPAANGVYFYQLKFRQMSEIKKMILLR